MIHRTGNPDVNLAALDFAVFTFSFVFFTIHLLFFIGNHVYEIFLNDKIK